MTCAIVPGLRLNRNCGISASTLVWCLAWRWVPACVAKRPGSLPGIIKNLVNLTDDQQKRLLQVNLPIYETIVRRGIHVYLTQNEFNALVSFVYNPGRGWPGVRAAINSGDKLKAVRIIEEQVRSKGKVLRGLVKRRHDEAMLLLKGRY